MTNQYKSESALFIQFTVLLSKLGYNVAAMHAAKRDIKAIYNELSEQCAPVWLLMHISYHHSRLYHKA